MKFSAQEEYGLRCLIGLAKVGPLGSLTIPEISEREGITPSHAAKLLAILRRSGFITSTRGQHGGYSIAKEPSQIKIRDVLEPLGGRLYGSDFCGRHAGVLASCAHESECLVHPLWSQVQVAVDIVLDRYTLEDLLTERIQPPLTQLSRPQDRLIPR